MAFQGLGSPGRGWRAGRWPLWGSSPWKNPSAWSPWRGRDRPALNLWVSCRVINIEASIEIERDGWGSLDQTFLTAAVSPYYLLNRLAILHNKVFSHRLYTQNKISILRWTWNCPLPAQACNRYSNPVTWRPKHICFRHLPLVSIFPEHIEELLSAS